MQKPFDELGYEIQPGDTHAWDFESAGEPPGCIGVASLYTHREGAAVALVHAFHTPLSYRTFHEADRAALALMNELQMRLELLQNEVDRAHG
jgi:hypothetical protein